MPKDGATRPQTRGGRGGSERGKSPQIRLDSASLLADTSKCRTLLRVKCSTNCATSAKDLQIWSFHSRWLATVPRRVAISALTRGALAELRDDRRPGRGHHQRA